jgi:hypothetical protein
MKRWPIGLALIGTLLAVGIAICAGRSDAPIRTNSPDLNASDDPNPVGNVDALSSIESELPSRADARAAIENTTLAPEQRVAETPRAIHFFVRDSEGSPIHGAIAQTLAASPVESSPTDAAGYGSLIVTAGHIDAIRVLALGYRSVTRQVAVDAAPVEVTLTRLPALNLMIRRSDGGVASDLPVEISMWAKNPFVVDEGDGSGPIQVDLGAPSAVRRSAGQPLLGEPALRFEYRTDDEGRLWLPGLDPTVRSVARVEDITGAVLAERELDATCFRLDAPCVISIDGPSRVLELRVVDESRKPIMGAKIRSTKSGQRLAKTRAAGVARISPIYANSVDLRVEAIGFASTSLDDLRVDGTIVRSEVVLTRGLSVRVSVVDATGRTVDAQDVHATLDSKRIGKVKRCADEDCVRIDELPRSTVVLSATVQGKAFLQPHDPFDPIARIEIPSLGSVVVDLSDLWTPPGSFEVVLSPESEVEGEMHRRRIQRHVSTRRSRNQSLDLPVVFAGRYTLEVVEVTPAEGGVPRRSRVENVVVRPGERTDVRVLLSR